MAGKRKTNEAGSSNGLRGDVLCVLGVLKAATADQIGASTGRRPPLSGCRPRPGRRPGRGS